MDSLFETIRIALANDATAEQCAAGADACRKLLALLDAKPTAAAATPKPALPELVQHLVKLGPMLRSVPFDQLLEVAVAQLRARLPSGVEVAGVKGLHIPGVTGPFGGAT